MFFFAHLTFEGYYNTDGLGLLEYLYWCEDLNAVPIMGVYAGYSLDGTSVPEAELGPYVQLAIDQVCLILVLLHISANCLRFYRCILLSAILEPINGQRYVPSMVAWHPSRLNILRLETKTIFGTLLRHMLPTDGKRSTMLYSRSSPI